MTDEDFARLDEIKNIARETYDPEPLDFFQIEWLISQLEAAWKEIEELRGCSRGRKACDAIIDSLESKISDYEAVYKKLIAHVDPGTCDTVDALRKIIRQKEKYETVLKFYARMKHRTDLSQLFFEGPLTEIGTKAREVLNEFGVKFEGDKA